MPKKTWNDEIENPCSSSAKTTKLVTRILKKIEMTFANRMAFNQTRYQLLGTQKGSNCTMKTKKRK